MSKVAEMIISGVVVLVALVIIFVRAGQKGGTSGGQQTAMIAQGLGSGGATLVQALQG